MSPTSKHWRATGCSSWTSFLAHLNTQPGLWPYHPVRALSCLNIQPHGREHQVSVNNSYKSPAWASPLASRSMCPLPPSSITTGQLKSISSLARLTLNSWPSPPVFQDTVAPTFQSSGHTPWHHPCLFFSPASLVILCKSSQLYLPTSPATTGIQASITPHLDHTVVP